MAIYVAQFGGIWRLTGEQWKTVVDDALHGDGYSLPGEAQLRGQPSFLKRSFAMGRVTYICTDPRHTLFTPLDWTKEDWRDAQTELTTPERQKTGIDNR